MTCNIPFNSNMLLFYNLWKNSLSYLCQQKNDSNYCFLKFRTFLILCGDAKNEIGLPQSKAGTNGDTRQDRFFRRAASEEKSLNVLFPT